MEAAMLSKFRIWVADAIMKFGRWVLRKRYDITFDGLDQIPQDPSAVILLPNHPAFIDPAIILTNMWKHTRCRPMIYKPMVSNPLLFWIKYVFKPLLVPDTTNTTSRNQARQVLEQAIEKVNKGENLLIYPSGQLRRGNDEVLGGISGLHNLIKSCPQATFIRIRTIGLYGSRFSYAWLGDKPNLAKAVFSGIFWNVASLFFFMPKRKVTIKIEKISPLDVSLMLTADSKEFTNRKFEQWYNETKDTKIYTPYHPWISKPKSYPQIKCWEYANIRMIYPSIRDSVKEIIQATISSDIVIDYYNDYHKPLVEVGLDQKQIDEITSEIVNNFKVVTEKKPETILDLYCIAQKIPAFC